MRVSPSETALDGHSRSPQGSAAGSRRRARRRQGRGRPRRRPRRRGPPGRRGHVPHGGRRRLDPDDGRPGRHPARGRHRPDPGPGGRGRGRGRQLHRLPRPEPRRRRALRRARGAGPARCGDREGSPAMTLTIRPASECTYDAVSLGEVMLRLDPGEGRIRTARSFRVWEGGGEYNVTRGLRRAFGLRGAVVTALADNEIGRLVEDFILTGGLDTQFIRWVPYDGIGRTVRNGLNFTERGLSLIHI